MSESSWNCDVGLALESRAEALAVRLSRTILSLTPHPRFSLDVGGGDGSLTRSLEKRTLSRYILIDPGLTQEHSATFVTSVRGSAFALPFQENTFDIVTLVSVYEHLTPPAKRLQALKEIRRVLKPGGFLVGQIPNMNFPIEIHSKLPLIQFLPDPIARWYYRVMAPIPPERKQKYGIRWYRVTPADLRRETEVSGFLKGRVWAANLPKSAIPRLFRPFMFVTKVIPLNWDFYFQK